MCRLLCVKSDRPVETAAHLEAFAALSRGSREYQGHGWGCAWRENGAWRFHHDIRPVWEDPARPAPRTTLLVAHARSAFRDEGIEVENNMPFTDGERVFAFNGELSGVRIRAEGRIGAEKLFRYLMRFDRGNLRAAIERGVGVVEKRTRAIRAMNFLVATGSEVHACSYFTSEPEYFQLRTARDGDARVVCSEPYGALEWTPIPNRSVETF